ncbi:MAG: CDP-alcohol phosphatidyltransferase family protein, partial [Lachnospiraceae bacterium]|nr:CDP-alcohol phosphatidyltransferase family protein [Lachnospiraceae bacterium]
MKFKKLIGYYDYTVVLTYAGMLSAFAGILNVIKERYFTAVIFLMLAGICDMFDGAVASTKDRTKSEKRFGIQIDSLSDLISFGVLPGVFTYMVCGKTMLSGIIAGFYVLMGLIRLAYYNVTEEERQETETGCRKCFCGVPITTIVLFLPIIHVLVANGKLPDYYSYIVLLTVMGIGFVTPVEI